MRVDAVLLERLMAELDLDVRRLDELRRKNETAARRVEFGDPDELDYAALGYTIHNLFNLIENYAARIAKAFENEVDPASWHRELIERMQIAIAGVRPSVWDAELARLIDELRRFRHVFRNMYANDLDPARVAAVQTRVPSTLTRFQEAHERFLERLAEMAADLDRGSTDEQ
jgi:uncharacterized protein YutE (UPF0331/DUF86 family)